jgi:peptidyl-tRNA hydrolase
MSTEEIEVPVFQLDEQQKNCSGYIMTPLITKKLHFIKNDPMLEWMEGSFAKIVVGVDSLEKLLELQKQAEESGIVNALITDNGSTEFKEECPVCHGRGITFDKLFLKQTEPDIEKRKKIDCSCYKCSSTGKIRKPTITCLAIGPDLSNKIDKITKELKLL